MQSLKEIQERKQEFLDLISQCSDYLMPGKYHVVKSFDDKYAIKHGMINVHSLREWYYVFSFGLMKVKQHKNKYNCSFALISPFRNYKLFDYGNDRVLTLYSIKTAPQAMMFYDYMAPYLNTAIDYVDREKRMFCERFIHSIQSFDYNACFRQFNELYVNYLEHSESKREINIKEAFDSLMSYEHPQEVKEYLTRIKNEICFDDNGYPVVVSHNDVHIKNFLTDDNKHFYLIDHELSGENVFITDVMGLIINSALLFRDDHMLLNFFQGEYDNNLEKLFGCYDIPYDKRKRKHYAYLALVFRLYYIQQIRPEHLQQYTKRIHEFIDRVTGYCQ